MGHTSYRRASPYADRPEFTDLPASAAFYASTGRFVDNSGASPFVTKFFSLKDI